MQILNIAGYKFISLMDLPGLRAKLLANCNAWSLKGTILISSEGINLNLAGEEEKIFLFKQLLREDSRLNDITFRESYSSFQPFDRMKVRIRNEIITMRRPEVRPEAGQAPSIPPEELKQWLDENRDITILDTRNDYEVQFGTFHNAVNLKIKDFRDFPEASEKVSKEKPIVMFCTGGIRCEKAALHLLNAGFSKVYQLQGGILNYFAKVGGEHYEGECFVFDNRVSVNADLETTGTSQCLKCQGPTQQGSESACQKCL